MVNRYFKNKSNCSPLVPEIRRVESPFEDSVIVTYQEYERKNLLPASDYSMEALVKAGLNPDNIVSISSASASGCRADSFVQFQQLSEIAESILTPPTGDMPENI